MFWYNYESPQCMTRVTFICPSRVFSATSSATRHSLVEIIRVISISVIAIGWVTTDCRSFVRVLLLWCFLLTVNIVSFISTFVVHLLLLVRIFNRIIHLFVIQLFNSFFRRSFFVLYCHDDPKHAVCQNLGRSREGRDRFSNSALLSTWKARPVEARRRLPSAQVTSFQAGACAWLLTWRHGSGVPPYSPCGRCLLQVGAGPADHRLASSLRPPPVVGRRRAVTRWRAARHCPGVSVCRAGICRIRVGLCSNYRRQPQIRARRGDSSTASARSSGRDVLRQEGQPASRDSGDVAVPGVPVCITRCGAN
jgi:hypothetical protein